MRCSKANRQLQLYLDHHLSFSQMHSLERHLSSCLACQEELFALEEITSALRETPLVVEPANLTATIMQRVASREGIREGTSYQLLRPSLQELLSVLVLATFTTFIAIIVQPSLRMTLPIANGHDTLSLAFFDILHSLLTNGNVMPLLWVIGTLAGVAITLVAAGDELRGIWFKAMVDRLPVW